jgi:hypothetical protein
MSDRSLKFNRRSILQYSLVLGSGIAVGSLATTGGSSGRSALAALQDVDPTATREAELKDLDDLRTQVANPPTCAAPPTATAVPPTATPTQVPLASTGVPLSFHDIWTITVLGIAPTVAPPETRPAGQFMRVNMTVSHSASTPKLLPITDFLLTDSAGRFSAIDIGVNQGLLGGTWALATVPGVTEDRAIVFDVATDAGDRFILESPGDPGFRVQLTVEQRG